MKIRLSKKVVTRYRHGHGGRPRMGAPISGWDDNRNQVLEWNQIFIDTLIATNTPNSSSQRLGAIVHAAIFDAYNGIEERYAADLRPRQRPSWRIAPGGSHRGGPHGAGRTVPVAAGATR